VSAVARDEATDAERDRIAWNLPRPRRADDTSPVPEPGRDGAARREQASDQESGGLSSLPAGRDRR
jgi:hypothetical protein